MLHNMKRGRMIFSVSVEIAPVLFPNDCTTLVLGQSPRKRRSPRPLFVTTDGMQGATQLPLFRPAVAFDFTLHVLYSS